MSSVRLYLLSGKCTVTFRLFIQLGEEIERNFCSGLIFLYVFRHSDYPAFHCTIFVQGDGSIFHSTALSLPVTDIEQDMALVGCREGVTLESHAGRSGQFCTDIVILQVNGIIAGRCNLFRMIKTGTIAASGRIIHGTGDSLQLAYRRHQDDAAHLKFMQAGETFDRSIPVIIAGSFPTGVIPQMPIGRRGRLCHPERISSRREMEPTAMCCPDTWLHILG